MPLLNFGTWVQLRDGDRDAYALYARHYSAHRYADGRRERRDNPNRFLFVGPGEKIVLMTPAMDAIFVWRKFIDYSGQTGVNCAVFRNEGTSRSSELILEAELWAWERWPGSRLYTYVNARKVKSTNPGYCFICAGWRKCGVTKRRKLLIFEKFPACGV